MSNTNLRFISLAIGIWVSFLLFGYCQEHLTRHAYGPSGERFRHTQALVVAQSLGNVLMAGLMIRLENRKVKGVSKWTAGVPVSSWLVVSATYLLAHSSGLAALKYIIFPLQVVIKSCKTVPVMIGEIVIARVKPSIAKSVGVLLLSAGVAVFTLSSESGRDTRSASPHLYYGVGLALLSLVGDAVYGPYQNKIIAKWKPSSWVLMFNMNLYELVMAAGYDFATSTEIQDTLGFLEKYPVEFGWRLAIFCLSMAIGNMFIFKMQREFGALSVSKTTTVRKVVSLILSIVWFGHSLNSFHYLAIGLVFGAPVVEKRVANWEKLRNKKIR
jgi:UDP-galactose transporter B1